MSVAESILRGLASGQRVTELPDHELAYMARRAGSEALYQLLRGTFAEAFQLPQLATIEARLPVIAVETPPSTDPEESEDDASSAASTPAKVEVDAEAPSPTGPAQRAPQRPKTNRGGAPKDLSSVTPKILAALKDRGLPIRSSHLAASIGATETITRAACAHLEGEGLISLETKGWAIATPADPAPAAAPAQEERRGPRPTREETTEARILSAIRTTGALTGTQLMELLGLPASTISVACSRMANAGSLVRTKTGRTTVNDLPSGKSASLKSTSRRRGAR